MAYTYYTQHDYYAALINPYYTQFIVAIQLRPIE